MAERLGGHDHIFGRCHMTTINTGVRNSEQQSVVWDEEYDLVVLGSGGAGFTAAVVASVEGLRIC